MRVLYLSDPLPAATTSGALVLHRHLTRLAPKAEIAIAHPEQSTLPVTHLRLQPRWIARQLDRITRGARYRNALESICGWRFADAPIDQFVETWRPDVILAVAQGGLCHNARRIARRHRLPLITLFHDWSPDWREHPDRLRRALERAFRRVHHASRIALCVSSGMKTALAPHADARVLHPIPDAGPTPALPATGARTEVVYAGVLNGLYQDDLLRLARQLAEASAPVGFAFFGPNPHWGDSAGRALIASPAYRGFVSAEELQTAQAASLALLVIMPFAPEHRRLAELSFPSKLTDYVRAGRPIVVWSPPYSSAAQWAQETGAALLVSDAHPAALLDALRVLREDGAAQRRLAERARHEAATRFSPDQLQQEFETALRDAGALTAA